MKTSSPTSKSLKPSAKATEPRIFVSIASYRDQFLQSTIDSLFANASFPENIRVGCFVQIIPNTADEQTCLVTNDWGGRVSHKIAHAGGIFSVTKCRNMASDGISADDDYFLQVDSHTRFMPEWDRQLVGMFCQLQNPKSLLSAYLDIWTIDDSGCERYEQDGEHTYKFATYCREFSVRAFMGTQEIVCDLERRESNQMLEKTWHLCGHFIFGPAEYPRLHPQNEKITFWGEELWNSLVAFTNGWDVYTPSAIPLLHLYPIKNKEINIAVYGREKPPRIWEDFNEGWVVSKNESTRLLLSAVIDGHEDFPLGKEKSLDDLFPIHGCDIRKICSQFRELLHKSN